MRIFRNAVEGREALLARRPLDVEELPMDVRETIFKPLSVPGPSDQQPDTTAPERTDPTAKPPETAGTWRSW